MSEMPGNQPSPTPSQQNSDNDKGELLPLEAERLHGEFREFYVRKRINLFASIQQFPALWDLFLLLDQIWFRGLSEFEHPSNSTQLVPLLFIKNAHAQYRTALELGFSTKLGDAWNVLRSAIESVVMGLKVHREPRLVALWLGKDRDKAQMIAFKKAFEDKKQQSLFPSAHGLDKLHQYYSQFSEVGTHSTPNAMAWRSRIIKSSAGQKWIFDYLETDGKKIALSLFSMLDASHEMEKACFRCLQDRLQLDTRLVEMRGEFMRCKSKVRNEIVSRFSLAPPAIWL